MSKGLINQYIRFLTQKIWHVACEQTVKKQENGRHYRKKHNFHERKNILTHTQGLLNQNIRFLAQYVTRRCDGSIVP